MSRVTASILVGGRHRYQGGIKPGWLVLRHEGRGVAWQLVRLHLFEGDEPGLLDEAPGVRWTGGDHRDTVGDLALLLQLHVVRDESLIEMVQGVRRLLQDRVVDLDDLDEGERALYDAAVARARRTGAEYCLAVSTLPKTTLDPDELMSLANWEVDIAQSLRSRDWDPFRQQLVQRERATSLADDAAVAVSRFVTGVAFAGIAQATIEDFVSRAAQGPAERTIDVLARWVLAGLTALHDVGAFADGESTGLAEVLDGLTPTQARLLAGFLPADGTGRIRGSGLLDGSGDVGSDLYDLLVLACRVTAHAVALTSNAEALAPWLVIDALDPTTARGLAEVVATGTR